MFSCFHQTYIRDHKYGITLNKKSELYYDYLKQVRYIAPDYFIGIYPKSKIRKHINKLVISPYFDLFISVFIGLNLLEMMVRTEDLNTDIKELINDIAGYFIYVYIIEAILKIIGLGWSNYFHNNWNKFDLFIVFSGTVELVLMYSSHTNSLSQQIKYYRSFQIIRVLKVFRVIKAHKFLKTFKGIEKLGQILRWSMNSILLALVLVILFLSIFAVIGCFLFKEITLDKYGEQLSYINDYFNMRNFIYSFMFSFRLATGEDWPSIMAELANIDYKAVSSLTSYMFFISLNFFTQVIVLNLFLLNTLQIYDEFHLKEENPIEKFNECFQNYRLVWNSFSSVDNKGAKIKFIYLPSILRGLNPELWSFKKEIIDTNNLKNSYIKNKNINNLLKQKEKENNKDKKDKENSDSFSEEEFSNEIRNRAKYFSYKNKITINDVTKIIIEMNPFQDEYGYIYFKDVFVRLLKLNFIGKIERNILIKNKEKQLMRNIHQEIQTKIFNLTQKQIMASMKGLKGRPKQDFSNLMKAFNNNKKNFNNNANKSFFNRFINASKNILKSALLLKRNNKENKENLNTINETNKEINTILKEEGEVNNTKVNNLLFNIYGRKTNPLITLLIYKISFEYIAKFSKIINEYEKSDHSDSEENDKKGI